MKRKKLFAASILPIAALIIFLVSGPNTKTPAVDVADATRLPAPRVALDGVPNSGKVTPTLFRGAQPSPLGFNSLAKSGIAVVVDLRFEGDRDAEMRAVTNAGMQYVGMPWSCHFPRDSITARFLQFLRANPGEKIFVHCEHGVDRTGLMIAAYRMAEQGLDAGAGAPRNDCLRLRLNSPQLVQLRQFLRALIPATIFELSRIRFSSSYRPKIKRARNSRPFEKN